VIWTLPSHSSHFIKIPLFLNRPQANSVLIYKPLAIRALEQQKEVRRFSLTLRMPS
jgi:hypothetical protein